MRNDDVISGLSGLTCEINNSDAEGRVVLADGVAHATALPPKLPGLADGAQPTLVVDMATLTGAQLIATGKRHAAVVSNLDEVEDAAVKAGKVSGDMVHPLPFVPEFYRNEFKSEVADMKNRCAAMNCTQTLGFCGSVLKDRRSRVSLVVYSVKDRSNAQSSCAANFVYEHLHKEYKGGWLHVDLAGPAFLEERGTGFGVGLALALLKVEGFDK